MIFKRLSGSGRFNKRGRPIFQLLRLWLMAYLVLGLAGTIHAQEQTGAIYVAEVRGIISPPVANYLTRILDEAESDNASLVIIQLDTPGGLDSSMREIIQAILDSPVPVAVYVTPSGGRASSAGLFILMASHIAAMAPNTNTGAAHPVGLGGTADETMTAKIESDAAAFIRSLAVGRERNADWAEQAVLDSVSVNEREALELNVIEFVATNLDNLIDQIEGHTVQTTAGTITLNLSDAPRHEASMIFSERFLHVILDPNLAFILLTIGTIGIIAELYSPGALVPGITGVIAFILAFYALGNLPTNWAGVALIVMAVILFIAELNTDTMGILSTGGIVAFLLGALILFRPFQPDSLALPDVRVNPWLIGITTGGVAAFVLFVVGWIVRARKSPLLTGEEQYIGQTAPVYRDLHPEGRVWFQGQPWFARSVNGQTVTTGQMVRIVGIEDLTLMVEPVEANAAQAGIE